MQTILSHISPTDVLVDPFPHIVVKNALPDELTRQLLAALPSQEMLTKGEEPGSNKRFSYSAVDVFRSPPIAPLWQEFIRVHTSAEFCADLLRIFGDHIVRLYSTFEKTVAPLSALRWGLRKRDDYSTHDILIDTQICINTPVLEKPTAVKVAHVDNANKLFAGLLYLRLDSDTATGSDLELYRFRDPRRVRFYGARLIEDKYLKRVTTIPYERGTLVFFLNGFDSLHGVTVRSQTLSPRYFVNFLGEVKEPLFSLDGYMETWFGKVARVVHRKTHHY